MTRKAVAGCAPAALGAFDFGFLVVAAPGLAADLGMTSAYAWLFSAGSLAYGAVVMPSERLLARIAAARVLAAGLAISAAGAALLAAAGDPVAALAGRVCFGAGTGVAAAPALVLLADEGAFSRLGGAIAVGFSLGVLLGATGTWRVSLIAVAALTVALAAVAASADATKRPRGGSAGALRVGAATVAAGASLALVQADPRGAVVVFAGAAVLAASAWRAVGRRLSGTRVPVLVACAAGGATVASGVGATVLIGRQLSATPAPGDSLVLALFGFATVFATAAARRLDDRAGPLGTAVAGLLAQAFAVLLIARVSVDLILLAPAVTMFGAAHVVASAGAAAAVMRAGDGAAAAAGLYVTGQYIAAGAGPLIVLGVAERAGDSTGAAVAGAIAAGGASIVAACQGRALTQSVRRSP